MEEAFYELVGRPQVKCRVVPETCFSRTSFVRRRGSAGPQDLAFAFLEILRTCTKNKNLCRGFGAHEDITKRGLIKKCSDALISMYARCGALREAKQLLEKHRSKEVVSWTALIVGYVQKGQGKYALDCYEEMLREGLAPNAVTFACALKACASMRAAEKGENIHDEIAKRGFPGSNVVLGNALVGMYAKCGAHGKAEELLQELPIRDVISWNALISGYVEHGKAEQALDCFERMTCDGHSPDAVTYVCLLKACGSIRAADKGEKLHDEIAKQGLGFRNANIILGTALASMYAKCGSLAKAQRVLEELLVGDVISWNALITAYEGKGEYQQVLNCFEQMQNEGISPNALTFASALKACGKMRAGEKGENIHDLTVKQGLLTNDIVLGNAVVDMYAKCGALAKAWQVLEELPVRDVITWNTLIAGYVEHGRGMQALDCFEQMQREALFPDAVTFACILKACGSVGAADRGEQIHDKIIDQGILVDNIVLGNALVGMYAKCDALENARGVLEELSVRNVVTWNALIGGYVEYGEAAQAFNCLEEMQLEGLSANAVTFTCVLKACAIIGAAKTGENFHDEIAKHGLLADDIVLGNALLGMYAKCGALQKSRRVLEELPARDVISWTTLIAGLILHGKGGQVLESLKQMQQDGLSPDAATLSGALTACSRLGLVESAEKLFQCMSTDYGLQPDLEHLTCMVDVFGRAGHFDKAIRLIDKMPWALCGVWTALLGACRMGGDRNVGRWAFEQAVRADGSDAAAYVLMAGHIEALRKNMK